MYDYMEITVSKLEWDSSFFELNVGNIKGTIKEQADLDILEGIIREHNYALCYYTTAEKLPESLSVGNGLEINLVDYKVTYLKEITGPFQKNQNPFILPAKNLSSGQKNTLRKLAIQSGAFSRFKNDKKIQIEKFEEMYALWMTNSLNGKIADEVMVYMVEDIIAGFFTVGVRNNRAEITLMAVDEPFRGRGIANAMIMCAESYFFEKGEKTIQIITQLENRAACMLYEKNGYKIEKVMNVYHFWAKQDMPMPLV